MVMCVRVERRADWREAGVANAPHLCGSRVSNEET